MAGLRNICRLYGGMKVTGANGKTVNYVWDYVADEPVTDKEMPLGSARWKASERRKHELLTEQKTPPSRSREPNDERRDPRKPPDSH